MNLLSIQSSVAYGHVGNSAAVFALQRLGHEVWPINTVQLSNHPGHGGFRGRVSAPDELADLVDGLTEHGWLGACDGVLTGYLGHAAQGPAIMDAVARVRAANPDAIWALDPVIGDHGRIFVKAGVPEFLRDRAAQAADILTPNGFELSYLTQQRCDRQDTALSALRRLLDAGAANPRRIVVATGLALADAAPDTLTILGASAAGAWRVGTPRIEHPANGAGDLFAALFLGRYLAARDLPAALAAAAAAVHGVIARSAAAGSRELLLIAAQDEITAPARRFPATPVP